MLSPFPALVSLMLLPSAAVYAASAGGTTVSFSKGFPVPSVMPITCLDCMCSGITDVGLHHCCLVAGRTGASNYISSS